MTDKMQTILIVVLAISQLAVLIRLTMRINKIEKDDAS